MNKGQKISIIVSIVGICIAIFLAVFDVRGFFNPPNEKETVKLSGEWMFEFHTKESSYNAYVNSITEYKMHIVQSGTAISASGETWSFNGEKQQHSKRNPLDVEGVLEGDSVVCKYRLYGKLRETVGSFKARLATDSLVGYFSGTGADVKGIFVAKRVR